MSIYTDILIKNGMQNATSLVDAAYKVGIPVYVAAAFAEHESGGANVFGHDAGGAYSGAGLVTQEKYNDFLRLVRGGHRSNGVGPMQITYPGYFKPVTDEVAGLWVPVNNMVFGLKIIRGYLNGNYSDASLNRAGQLYNSGSATGAPQYGTITVSLCHKWYKLLLVFPTLQQGSTGNFVRALQTEMNRVFPLYSHLESDGIFGTATASVVREFQRRARLTVDGIVGPQTLHALRAMGAQL